MALINRKVNEWERPVSSLENKPKLTAEELKAAFDSNTNQLKPVINGMIDDLTSAEGAGNIGISQIQGLAGNTVQQVLQSTQTGLAERYTKTETDSQITTRTKDLVQSIQFDENTGIFTIIKRDGSNFKIDTVLEKVPAKFELISSGNTVKLRITNIDGTNTETDVTRLMSGYSFKDTDSISFTMTGEGSTKQVSATIRTAGVTKAMLAADAVTYLEQLERLSSEHKYYAEQSAIKAEQYAQKAQQYSGNPPIIEDGNWKTWNADTQNYIDTGFPAKGEKGEQGRGLQILGYYDTLELLQAGEQSPNAGDTYGVGTDAPYLIYIWDSVNSVWVNNGEIQGIQGEKGDPGTPATINGVNTLEIISGDNIELEQSGSQLIINAKCNKNKKAARFVVGTSASGWTADDCDYLCDGTDDQVEINAAIQALSENGGEVIILDGTYNITGIIEVNKVNTKLSGNGKSTILKRMWKSSHEGVIKVSKNYCTISNLQIDGNDSVYSYGYGIHIVGIFFNLIVTDITITGVICNNNNTGIVAEQISNSIISGNTCCYNANTGIEIAGSETNLPSSSNIITNNVCNNNKVYGIKLYACDKSTVTSNICNDNVINMIIGESDNNTITGNTCIRGSGLPSDYTSNQYTMDCTGNNNLIVGNNIMGKNYTDSGTGNTWANNKYQ